MAQAYIDTLRHIGPRCKVEHHPDDPKADVWGIRYREIDYGTGTYGEAEHHLAAHMTSVSEIDAYRWPSADDYDYTPVTEFVQNDDGYRAVRAASYEPFLLYCYLRGIEQSFEDLLVNPEIAEAILGHLFDIHYEMNRRTFEAGGGKIDVTYVAEDLGSQTGPLIGLETYRKFLGRGRRRWRTWAVRRISSITPMVRPRCLFPI